MPSPRELPQQIPAPRQKLGCKSTRVGANLWCKSREYGRMVMAKIDNCIKPTEKQREIGASVE